MEKEQAQELLQLGIKQNAEQFLSLILIERKCECPGTHRLS